MTQTTSRFFDEIARLMNDAAGVAQGVRREVDTVFKTQAERWLRDLDLVKREEFEAVKDMARLAREENEALKARIAALEAKLPGTPALPADLCGRTGRHPAGRLKPAIFSLSLSSPALSGYKPARPRPPHPWRHAAVFFLNSNARTRTYSYGDRQGIESDGASEGR